MTNDEILQLADQHVRDLGGADAAFAHGATKGYCKTCELIQEEIEALKLRMALTQWNKDPGRKNLSHFQWSITIFDYNH
jgi:hypothetical protein